jgi:hypothetical protein
MSAFAAQEAEGYNRLEGQIRNRIAYHIGPLFLTDANEEGLWLDFLESLPVERRQHYHCSCCRRFIQKYGPLVTIDEKGQQRSLLWDPERAPEFFKLAVTTMAKRVEKAKVYSVFYSEDPVWGNPSTDAWTHFSGTNPSIYRRGRLNASQQMAKSKHDYQVMLRRLGGHPTNVAEQNLIWRAVAFCS